MTAASVGLGFLAGALSTLSPCVVPLLPIVLGSAAAASRAGPLWLALGVACAFTAAGLFVATVGFAIGLDGDVFRVVSAVMLGVVGVVLMSRLLQGRLALATGGLGGVGDRLLRRLEWGGNAGQFATGALLGLVWSPCAGPTLGAASLLAAQGKDLPSVATVMFAFGLGTTAPLLAVAALSRQATSRWRGRMLQAVQGGKLLARGGLRAGVRTNPDRRGPQRGNGAGAGLTRMANRHHHALLTQNSSSRTQPKWRVAPALPLHRAVTNRQGRPGMANTTRPRSPVGRVKPATTAPGHRDSNPPRPPRYGAHNPPPQSRRAGETRLRRPRASRSHPATAAPIRRAQPIATAE